MITDTMIFLQLVLTTPWQGDDPTPLCHPVLPRLVCGFFPQYDNPVMRGTFSSQLNILSEASEVQFIMEINRHLQSMI